MKSSRSRQLLTVFAEAILRGADVPALLEKVRETYGQRGVSLVRESDTGTQVLGTAGAAPPCTPESADTIGELDAGPYALLLAGPRLRPRDRRILTAITGQAAALIRENELVAEAAHARELTEKDRLRSVDVTFSPQDTAELLATIEESTDQLTRLVTNLLDSSRLAAGVLTSDPRPVYVDEVAHSAVLSLTGIPGLDRIDLAVGDTLVTADGALLERVLANLLDNALRYAPTGPITVCATTPGENVIITVTDHGPGLGGEGEDSREDVFAVFPRTDDQRTGGAGLGLTVARGFVEVMSGTLTAAETPGGGARW